MNKNRICNLLAAAVLVLPVVATNNGAHAQTYSVLYNFGSKSEDPRQPGPPGIIAQGRDGNLHTTAAGGGATGFGTAFMVTPTGTLTLTYNYNDSSDPVSGLTLGSDGNFYGTALGGPLGHGTVFKVTPHGTVTVLHDFAGGSDGDSPYAPPIQGTDGNFYGTTSLGGGKNSACGGAQSKKFRVIP